MKKYRIATCMALISFIFMHNEIAAETARRSTQVQLQDEWFSCMEQFTKRVTRKNQEPAERIVRAAFSKCQKEEERLWEFFVAGLSSDLGKKIVQDRLFPSLIEYYTDKLYSIVLEERASE